MPIAPSINPKAKTAPSHDKGVISKSMAAINSYSSPWLQANGGKNINGLSSSGKFKKQGL